MSYEEQLFDLDVNMGKFKCAVTERQTSVLTTKSINIVRAVESLSRTNVCTLYVAIHTSSLIPS